MRATLRLVALLAAFAADERAFAQQGGGAAVMPPLNLLSPEPVKALGPASAVATSLWASCAVVKGVPWCWGQMSVFDAGRDRHVPQRMAVKDVTQLSVSQTGACALTTSGSVLCWGRGFGGRKPRRVAGLAPATKVSAGNSFACALLKDGHVACWGTNHDGQLGQEPRPPAPAPASAPAGASRPRPTPITRRKGESDGSYRRRLILEQLKAAPDLPRVLAGEDVGPPAPQPPSSDRALVVPELDRVVDLAAGDKHACAVRATGQVVCWGDRDIEYPERLGILARPEDRRGPDKLLVVRTGERHRIPQLADAVAVSAGDRQSCALRRGGRVSCWNEMTYRTRLVGPRDCVGVEDAVALADHGRYVVRATGAVVRVSSTGCYGPRPEPGVTDVVEASTHCARRKDGAVVCWGTNEHGELGRPATPFYRTR